jgi:hypothetical protein
MIRLLKDIEGQEMAYLHARKGEYVKSYDYNNGNHIDLFNKCAILNNEWIYTHRDISECFNKASRIVVEQEVLDKWLVI